jgi:hypothetical protein
MVFHDVMPITNDTRSFPYPCFPIDQVKNSSLVEVTPDCKSGVTSLSLFKPGKVLLFQRLVSQLGKVLYDRDGERWHILQH